MINLNTLRDDSLEERDVESSDAVFIAIAFPILREHTVPHGFFPLFFTF